jgi:hypothetical protein
MLVEVYAQVIDATGIYSVYFALLLSMSLSAFWIVKDTSFIESCLVTVKYNLSSAETAYKAHAELGLSNHLLILKIVKIKIDPGDEESSFFSFNY